MARYEHWMTRMRRVAPRLVAKYGRPKREGEGERLPDFVHETGNEYFRLDLPKPAAYVKCVGPELPPSEHVWNDLANRCDRCGMTGIDVTTLSTLPPCSPVSWWYCDPLGHWGRFEREAVTEHEDGTVTVEGLIANAGLNCPVWRGYLREGIWEAENG